MGGKACRNGGQDFHAAPARTEPRITVRVDGQRMQTRPSQSVQNILARMPFRGAQAPDALEFAGQTIPPKMRLMDAGVHDDAQLSVVYRFDPARCPHPRLQFGHASPEGYRLLCPDCGIEPSVAFYAPRHGDHERPVMERESPAALKATALWRRQPNDLCCHPFSVRYQCIKCGKPNKDTAVNVESAMTAWKFGPGIGEYTRRVGQEQVARGLTARRRQAQRVESQRLLALSRKHIWQK
jgi:hypothetical protein